MGGNKQPTTEGSEFALYKEKQGAYNDIPT